MKLVIIYELANREYDNALLLKCELERRGHKVAIRDKATCFRAFDRPDYLIIPNCYTTSDYECYVYMANADNAVIVNLQYEQVLSEANEKLGLHNPRGLAQNAYHLCWGKRTKERLLGTGISDTHISVTGAMQLDFLRPSFRNYFIDKQKLAREFNLDTKPKWVLYISDFVFNEKFDKTKLNSETRKEFNRITEEVEEKTVECFKRILSDEKDILLIYRPHPAETVSESIIALAGEYPNFRIIAQYSIKEWIVNVDCAVTWMSSALIECVRAQKKVVIFRPMTLPQEYDSFMFYDLPYVDNVVDLVHELMNDNTHDFSEAFERNVEPFYQNTDSLAVELTADAILNSKDRCNIHHYLVKRLKFMVTKQYFIKSILECLYTTLYKLIGFKMSRLHIPKRSYLRILENRIDNYDQTTQAKQLTKESAIRKIMEKQTRDNCGEA